MDLSEIKKGVRVSVRPMGLKTKTTLVIDRVVDLHYYDKYISCYAHRPGGLQNPTFYLLPHEGLKIVK